MFRQSGRRQFLKLGKISTLALDLVHQGGQTFRQMRGLGKIERAATGARIPAADQSRQQKLAADGGDGGRQIHAIAGGVEQQIVFFTVTNRAELRQQRRSAQSFCESLAESARRAPRRQIDNAARQRQGAAAHPRDQAIGQALRKIRPRRDGEKIGTHLAAGKSHA